MKKKTLKVLVCAIVLLVCITGCGKTRSDKLAEMYENEYGMSEEEASEWAEYENEFYEEMNESGDQYSDEAQSEEEFEENITLVKVKDEVKNAALTDNICQVYDAVIKTDGTMNLKDVFNLIQESTDFEVSIDCNEGAVVNGIGFNSYKITDEYGKTVCYIEAFNDTSATNDAFNQLVLRMEKADDGVHAYNFFMASGIMDIYNKVEPYKAEEAKAYHQRIDEIGGEVRYDAIENFLTSHGVTHIQKISDDTYGFISFDATPVAKFDGNEEQYKYTNWQVSYDGSTGNMSTIFSRTYIGAVDDFVAAGSVSPLFEEMDEETKQAVIDAAIDGIDNDTIYGDRVSGVEFVSFAYDNEKNLHEILKDDQDRYIETEVSLSYTSNGHITADGTKSWYNDTYNSIDDVIAEYGLTIIE